MRVFFFISLLTIVLPVYSQQHKRGNVWPVGHAPVIRFDFNSQLQLDTVIHSFQFAPACVIKSSAGAICDTSGNLLLFTNGFIIYNKDGFGIQNGTYHNCPYGTELANYYGGASLFDQTSIILPKKGNTYYVFSTGMSDSVANNYLSQVKAEFDILNYSIVDMDSNGGNGKVTVKNKILTENQHYANCALTAVRHSNGKDWWLVKADANNFRYQLFNVQEDTILGPFYQYVSDTSVYSYWQGQIYFSQDGKTMVSSVFSGKYYDSASCNHLNNDTKRNNGDGTIFVPNRIDVYDFDRCEGKLTFKNYHVASFDTASYPWGDSKIGLAISPNNKYAYMSTLYSIFQIDLDDTSKNNATYIHGPDTNINIFPKYRNLAVAPNGKMYIGNWDGTRKYMSFIDKPDMQGLGCDFVANGLFQPYTNLLDPPNMPYFGLGADSNQLNCWPVGTTPYVNPNQIQILVYPNPASRQINVICQLNSNEKAIITLYDVWGREVLEKELNNQFLHTLLDIGILKRGLYAYKIVTNQQRTLMGKLVKE